MNDDNEMCYGYYGRGDCPHEIAFQVDHFVCCIYHLQRVLRLRASEKKQVCIVKALTTNNWKNPNDRTRRTAI